MTGVDTVAAEPTPRPRRRRRLPWFFEVLVVLVAVALVQAFVAKPFGVPSQSMEDTLHIGDRILVNRLDEHVDRGDVVVFGHGATWQERRLPASGNPFVRAARAVGDVVGIGPSNTAYTVKRVIGLPGERVACCSVDGRVTVDDQPLSEPYVVEDLPFTAGSLDCSSSPRSTRCFPEITVPKENLLVLGDHRSQSADSVLGCRGSTEGGGECARFVPMDRVVGPVVLRFWPPGDVGGIRH
ncbi:signal peptidase I [Phycicoccus sp.]|uniref:signal peptidase I n=1 Tax=Phycicoccus sp. TaxID=1902410 RepID=UPI002D059955|nr:signal peptidase I [Phycicoccus sp.]HMM97347.1 signal peptidase I [Phycicoccus sp.]